MHSDEIGWIGTGVMGAPLCKHLINAGYQLNVYNRTPGKAQKLINMGASWCGSSAEVAERSSIIFTMVGTPDEVRDVYFGERGIVSTMHPESVVVDLGTTPASLTGGIWATAVEHGCDFIDAPVTGGDVGAVEGELTIMAGGDEGIVEALRPLFDCFGSLNFMGPSGSGQNTKMCNQISVAGNIIGMCEALLYAARSKLTAERMLTIIQRGSAACWTLDSTAPRIIDDDMNPGAMVDHFVKDLGIVLAECEIMNLRLPGTALAHELFRRLQSQGKGQLGVQALIQALREMNA